MSATAVDRLQGLTTSVAVKPPCVAVTTFNTPLTGLYTVGTIALDEGDRVLVQAQSNPVDNGIYVAASSDWQRALDFDGARDVVCGTLVLVRNSIVQGAMWEVTTPDEIIIGTSPITFELRDNPEILYEQTLAEIAGVVTPINKSYLPGIVDRYGINSATADMTVAIRSALAQHLAGGPPVTFLNALYKVTDTPIAIGVTQPRVTVQGVPLGSRIVNKAGANKPTIKLSGASYFDISGLVLIGATGFPNDGIQLLKDGSGNRTAFGSLRNIVCNTNGYGIEIQDTNTVTIEDYSYWPSGGNSFGGTIDTNGQPGGIFASGTGAVNGITISQVNIGDVNSIATGGCGISFDGRISNAPFQGICIENVECEPSGKRSIWFRNVNIGSIHNVFTENTEVRLDSNCIGISISDLEAGASGTVVIDGTQPLGGCFRTLITNSQGKSFTADAANSETVQINNIWPVAPGNSDASINRVQINVRTTGAILQPDTYNPIWVTPTFAAGVYTSSAGSWTVDSGDELTREYLIQGKRATVNFHVTATTVAGTPGALFVALPNSMQSAKDVWVTFMYSEDNGTTTKVGFGHLQAANNQLALYKDLASTAWANTTNLTKVSFSATFEIV